MLLPILLFLVFSLWVLLHWHTLPGLLRTSSDQETWPLSIHHTATPLRLAVIVVCYAAFAVFLLLVLTMLLELLLPREYAPWVALVLLIGAHFAPYLGRLSAYVRYLFQRHLFFPALPSHQEDAIIRTLMAQAPRDRQLAEEIEHLHDLIRREFGSTIQVMNLVSLKNEALLVQSEVRKMRHQGLLDKGDLGEEEEQQMRFHLYSCYRLLTRMTLARYWAGRDRRQAFRRMGYMINAADGEVYATCRRVRHWLTHSL